MTAEAKTPGLIRGVSEKDGSNGQNKAMVFTITCFVILNSITFKHLSFLFLITGLSD